MSLKSFRNKISAALADKHLYYHEDKMMVAWKSDNAIWVALDLGVSLQQDSHQYNHVFDFAQWVMNDSSPTLAESIGVGQSFSGKMWSIRNFQNSHVVKNSTNMQLSITPYWCTPKKEIPVKGTSGGSTYYVYNTTNAAPASVAPNLAYASDDGDLGYIGRLYRSIADEGAKMTQADSIRSLWDATNGATFAPRIVDNPFPKNVLTSTATIRAACSNRISDGAAGYTNAYMGCTMVSHHSLSPFVATGFVQDFHVKLGKTVVLLPGQQKSFNGRKQSFYNVKLGEVFNPTSTTFTYAPRVMNSRRLRSKFVLLKLQGTLGTSVAASSDSDTMTCATAPGQALIYSQQRCDLSFIYGSEKSSGMYYVTAPAANNDGARQGNIVTGSETTVAD